MKQLEEKFWYDKVLEALDRWRLVTGLTLLGFVVVGGFVLLVLDSKHKPVVTETREVVEEKVVPVENTEVAGVKTKVEPKKTETSAHAAAPVKTEAKTATALATSQTSPAAPKSMSLVNINTASAAQLDALPGIGPVLAKRIVDYRSANGPFKTIQDVKNVKGIGDKTFEKFKDQITI